MSLIREVKTLSKGWRWFHRPLVPASAEIPGAPAREFPTDWARSPAAVSARRLVLGGGFGLVLNRELRIHRQGTDVLDDLASPVIFIANHSSHLDAPLVLTSLPARWRDNTASGAAADYFFDVWWRAAATALAFNAFPIGRSGARRSTGVARKLLDEGWNLLIFPEGTRSPDGMLREFKQGAANLALDRGIPVVPIAVRGSYQAMPRGRSWPMPGRPTVRVRFGRPIFPSPGESVPAFSSRMLAQLTMTLDEDQTTWWESLKAKGSTGPVERESSGLADAPVWRRKWESSRPLAVQDARRGAD